MMHLTKCHSFQEHVSGSILKIVIYRIEQVYIFIDSAYLCVLSTLLEEQTHAYLFKHSSDCLQVFLFELEIHCDLGLCWELLVPSGA